ncbi:MAG: hypothetical protein Q9157_006188 [Trypethelium eluteriae]
MAIPTLLLRPDLRLPQVMINRDIGLAHVKSRSELLPQTNQSANYKWWTIKVDGAAAAVKTPHTGSTSNGRNVGVSPYHQDATLPLSSQDAPHISAGWRLQLARPAAAPSSSSSRSSKQSRARGGAGKPEAFWHFGIIGQRSAGRVGRVISPYE